MPFGCPLRLWCLPGWLFISYTGLNPSLSYFLPFWAHPLSNTSSSSSMPSSFTLSESLFLQRILVSAFPGLHSLVQATSISALKKPTGPGIHTAAPNLSQTDIFQRKVGSHQPQSLEPLMSSHCSRDKAKAITSDLLLPEWFALAHSLTPPCWVTACLPHHFLHLWSFFSPQQPSPAQLSLHHGRGRDRW